MQENDFGEFHTVFIFFKYDGFYFIPVSEPVVHAGARAIRPLSQLVVLPVEGVVLFHVTETHFRVRAQAVSSVEGAFRCVASLVAITLNKRHLVGLDIIVGGVCFGNLTRRVPTMLGIQDCSRAGARRAGSCVRRTRCRSPRARRPCPTSRRR